MLQYGYGRWDKIKKISLKTDKILATKSDGELIAYANDFTRTLFENLHPEKSADLRSFLINLNQEGPNIPYVKTLAKEWSDQISQRAIPWGKRLQLLDRVSKLFEKFKQAKDHYCGLHEAGSELTTKEISDQF